MIERRKTDRVVLTDRFIRTRKPAAFGQRDEYRDAVVPGLYLRVTATEHKSFVLVARYPGGNNSPARRHLGDYGAITLDKAREKARGWLELVERGIDPRANEQHQKAAVQRVQVNTFAAVAADFLDGPASRLVKAKEIRSLIESVFVSRWGKRPIVDIAPEEISAAVSSIAAKGHRHQAAQALAYIRNLFNWAVGTARMQTSPVDRLKLKALVGRLAPRQHRLRDEELRKLWVAAGSYGYPFGSLVQMLLLTGQRLREVAEMTWPEIEGDNWVISASRMKHDTAHVVPLPSRALALLKSLPRANAGDFVFSTTFGAKAVSGFSKAKVIIDKMSGVCGWRFHDLRRTMRSGLSALPVEEHVRELTIGHRRKGIEAVYDLHAYQSERRRCLELWEQRLMTIVEPPPPDVASLADRGGAGQHHEMLGDSGGA